MDIWSLKQMKQKFVQPVFNDFKKSLNKHDLKSARKLRQEVHNIVRKKPSLPPYDRAADMLYNVKEGNEIDAIIEARFLAKLPELNSDIVQSVIDTFSDFNYFEELIDYLNLVHTKYPQDIATTESYFSQLFLNRRYNQSQIVAMELYRLKKSSQNQLYAAAASFIKAKTIEETIKKFEAQNINSDQTENLEKQRILYYSMTITLVTQSGDDCLDGKRLVVESQIALEKFDEALLTLESISSKDPITYYRLKLHALYQKNLKTNSLSDLIAETAIQFLETISVDSIDEWRLVVQFHPNPLEIINRYIQKSRGASLAKIEYCLKEIKLNSSPEKVDQFIQSVLEYSNKYSNQSFVLEDLMPYLKFEYPPTIFESKTFSLKPIFINFSDVIKDDIKQKLYESLKNSNDLFIRSFVNQTFSKDILHLNNSKSIALFMEFMLKQYSNTNDLNYLIQAISMFFKMNSNNQLNSNNSTENNSEDNQNTPQNSNPKSDQNKLNLDKTKSQNISENDKAKANSSTTRQISELNKQFSIFQSHSQLSQECIALLLRSMGLWGTPNFQQGLFLTSLNVDSIQFLSLAPLIVPDIIKNWDLQQLQDYMLHVAKFTRISLSIYMKNHSILPSFNRKNFFSTFDSPQLKYDIEMNEVAYLFQLLEFLLKGACSIVRKNENKQKDIQNSGICLLNSNLSGHMYLNEFNYKKVAPCQKEILKQYYGKYDTSIVPLYFDDCKLREAIYPSYANENPIQKALFELDAVMNLIFTMKFEKERKMISKNEKSEIDNLLLIIKQQLNDPIWNVIWEFAKSGNLDLYDQIGQQNFDLIQTLSLVGICISNIHDCKEKVKNIVKNESDKVISLIKQKIEFKLNPDLYDPEILSINEVQKWKDDIGNETLKNQIIIVQNTTSTLLKALD